MNEDVLATAILRNETESLFDVVPFDRTETFLRRSLKELAVLETFIDRHGDDGGPKSGIT